MPGTPRTCDDRGVSAAEVPTDAPEHQVPTRVRKLYRIPEGRMISGVANGLATHLGLPVFWVRAAFVVLLLGNGLGALLYAAFWFAVPMGMRAGSPPTTWQSGSIGPYSLVKEPTGWRRGLRAVQQTLQGEPLDPSAPRAGRPRRPPRESPPSRPRRRTGGRCWP